MAESITFTAEEAPLVYAFGAFWPVTHISTSVEETNRHIYTAPVKTGVMLEADGVIYSAPYTPIVNF